MVSRLGLVSRTHQSVENNQIVRPFVRCYIRRMMMRYLSLFAVLLAGSLLATAQTSSIVGTWALSGADKLLPDGTRVFDFGPNPHGLVIFTADGYYSVQIYRAERGKFSSGDK